MVGTATFSVCYSFRTLPAFTFQVSRHCANLLGFDLFCALGLSIKDNTGATTLTVTTPWQQRWPSLFTGLGCLTAFNHQPLINRAVSPVSQPRRRLHNDDLSMVLYMLVHDNLTLNYEKCIFAVPVIEFMGFRLTADSLSPLHSDINPILRQPELSCPTQLSSSLGMSAYYLPFLPHYSNTTTPLRNLLKQDAPWSWKSAFPPQSVS